MNGFHFEARRCGQMVERWFYGKFVMAVTDNLVCVGGAAAVWHIEGDLARECERILPQSQR